MEAQTTIIAINGDNIDPLSLRRISKKKRGPLNLIRVALFMLRRRSTAKSGASVHVDVASKGLWRRLVGAMRPLHHPSQPPRIESRPAIPKVESFHDVIQAPVSPSRSECSSSSDDRFSLYASALNLQELDKSEEGCDQDGGDEMIDSRAEEFIAQFYEQMRLQRLESMERYYNAAVRNESAQGS